MANFDIIPFVFEFARIRKGCVSDPNFSMTYDEYLWFSKIFADISEDEKMQVIKSAKSRSK